MAYTPETDGQSEHFHCSIEQVIYCYVLANQKDWDRYLHLSQFTSNSKWIATIGYSPAIIVFCREPMLHIEHDVRASTDGQAESVVNCLARMTAINKAVQASVTKASEYMVSYGDRSCCPVTFELNDYVWLLSEYLSLP